MARGNDFIQFSGFQALRNTIQELIDAFTTTQDYRVTTDLYYAPFQEYGTVNHGPQPHFRPAIQSAGASMSSNANNSVTVADLQQRTAEEILSETRRRAPVRTGQLRNSYYMEAM